MSSVQEPGAVSGLEQEFTNDLYSDYRHVARTVRYHAKYYLEMVTMHGGVGAAQILLRGPNTSDGFERLWREQMLRYSLEAVVIKPKYAALFTDEELRTARLRLEQHEFDVERYLASLPRNGGRSL